MITVILLLAVLMWLGAAVYVGLNASDHGKSILWGVFVFITGPFGISFYALTLANEAYREVQPT